MTPVEPIHKMLLNPDNAISVIEYFPAHAHDGGIGVPRGEDHASVIAAGVRWVTHGAFNLIVAFERGTISTETLGRNGFDESPAGYSLASCSPAELASASAAGGDSEREVVV